MNKALIVILATVALNAIGGGLIFPILPELLKQMTAADDISLIYGLLIGIYALMQFVLSPVLGSLSDRFGRRPVLLLSLAGAMVDYLIMAFSPFFWVLAIGRVIAGITSASMAVASAYMTDITPEEHRAQRFGLLGAVMGVGFIIGPVLGGLLGIWWLRAPFLAAAILNGLNLLMALFVLPESHATKPDRFALKSLNPVAPLVWLWNFRPLLPLIVVAVVFGVIASVPGTIWVLYGADRFGWDSMTIGLSLSVFGVSMAISQAVLTGPIVKRFGDRGTLMIGVAFDGVAYVLMGFADQGWMGFALTPLFALGGIAMPALQSLLTSRVSQDQQGQLQGVMASLMSLAGVVGPLAGAGFYFYTRDVWMGSVWIAGAVLYLAAAPLFATIRQPKPVAA